MLRSACYSFGIIILEMRVLLWFVIASRSDCSSVREHSDRSKRYAMHGASPGIRPYLRSSDLTSAGSDVILLVRIFNRSAS